ncbi:MAG TPA: hypothetical protein VIU15_34610 [Streptomyces sp.]
MRKTPPRLAELGGLRDEFDFDAAVRPGVEAVSHRAGCGAPPCLLPGARRPAPGARRPELRIPRSA